jgi:glycosyltransferase involved in cell wall biosynthesis
MIVLYPFIGNRIGGSHICMSEYINKLREVSLGDYQLRVVVHEKNDNFSKKLNLNEELLPIPEKHFAKTFSSIIMMPLTIYKLVKYLIKNKIDIVHTSDNRMHFAWGIASKFTKTKWIYHCHNQKITKFSLVANYYVFVSKFVAKSNKVKSENQAIVYNTFFFDRNKLLDFKRDKIICFVGSYTKQKRLDFFIEIIARLHKERDDFKVFIFGDMRNRDNELKEKICKERLLDTVFIKGFTNNILDEMERSKVLCAISINEAFGRTLLEGMSVGCIVVASESGGHVEIMKNEQNGFIVKDYEILRALSRALDQDIDDHKRIYTNAQNTLEKYSLDYEVKKIIKIYKLLSI